MDGSNLSAGVGIYLDICWLNHDRLLPDLYGWKYEYLPDIVD